MSISKPYVRPIVRGKEAKSVEFGAKCNNIQVDGLSFIEELSFNGFNEGARLPHCLKMHRKLFGVDAKKVGGDAGYAGNANREYCRERGIQTSFVKRGRPSFVKKENDIISNELAKIPYIFLGIHTANVVQLVRREATETVQAADALHAGGPFTGALAPVVSENEEIGSKTSRQYKKR